MLHWLFPTLLFASAAVAQDADRRFLDAEEAKAYHAVGRLNVAGTRFCTATLIAPGIIVTAAHCLFHPRTHARVPLSEMRFVAGLHLDERAAVRQPVRAVTLPEFDFDGMADFAGVRADLALLELDVPVADEAAVALVPGALQHGKAPLAIVSYARDRPQAPSIEAPCALASTFGGVAALDCAVKYGASGAPVLQIAEDGAHLVAVVSAMGRVLANGRAVTLAVLAAPAIDALLAALPEAPPEE